MSYNKADRDRLTSEESMMSNLSSYDKASDECNNNATDTYFIQKKSKMCKLLVLLVLLLTIALVILTALYISASTSARKVEEEAGELCTTKECVQIAARVIDVMDESANPCEDFYQYACGGWLKNTPIPDSRARYSTFDKLSKENAAELKRILDEFISNKRNTSTPLFGKAATFYKACKDIRQITKVGDAPMKTQINDVLGSWPVTNSSFDADSWDIQKALVAAYTQSNVSPLFNIYVNTDIKNSSENVIVFDQAGILLSRETYLFNSSFYNRHREAYKTLMTDIAEEMGAKDEGLKLMEDVFEFETRLANITKSVAERRNYHNIYESMTLNELSNRTAIPLNWLLELVNAVFQETGQTITPSKRVVSFNTHFIKHAYKMFVRLPKKVQASYIVWHSVRSMATLMLGRYQDIFDQYKASAYSTSDRTPRWQSCIKSTLASFGYVLARPFVEEVYDRTAKDMSTEMIRAIRGIFIDNLQKMDWMDEDTKKYAKFKAERILENIGYPESIMNDTALLEKYEGLEVVEGQYFSNIMKTRKFQNLNMYKKLGKPVDKSKWSVLPTTVNAYYSPTENKIGFPAGILQWPYYDKRAPRAVSYGAIGMVVGHEISHGFDDQGKDFTVEGNLDTWWSNSSAEAFREKSTCFEEQYSKFQMFGKNINGKQTLGENLADNGGLQMSLQAYRAWQKKNKEKVLPGLSLTSEQTFFTAFAQVWCTNYRESAALSQIGGSVHSLSKFRVIGTLQNSEDFSRAYKCPLNSVMNPPKKCKVW